MDPIKEGGKIFKRLCSELGKAVVTNIEEVAVFFSRLIKETSGWVIVDFLDSANWDCLSGFEIDEATNVLFLYWRDYRNTVEDPEDESVRRMAFPVDLCGLMMHFQELRVLSTKLHHPFFILRGYALTDSEITRIMEKGSEQFKIFPSMANFSKLVVRKVGAQWHSFNCLNTPIYSAVILPKDTWLNATDSSTILYRYNLLECATRLGNAIKQLDVTVPTDSDAISEKGNTFRRILEMVLKIEICYRHMDIKPEKPYSQLLVGNLIGLVKDFREEADKLALKEMAKLSNQLSHDTGKPVIIDDAKQLASMALSYTKELMDIITNNPFPAIREKDKSTITKKPFLDKTKPVTPPTDMIIPIRSFEKDHGIFYSINLDTIGKSFRLQRAIKWRDSTKKQELLKRDYVTQDPNDIIKKQVKNTSVAISGKKYSVEPVVFNLAKATTTLHYQALVYRKLFPEIPSLNQLQKAIHDGNDREYNCLVLNVYGEFELRQPKNYNNMYQDPTVVVRHEISVPGNGYVGPEAAKDTEYVETQYRTSLYFWNKHLKSYKTNYFIDMDVSKSIKQIVAEMEIIEAEWKSQVGNVD